MSERLEVPQATLERTREIVDAVASGAVSRAGVAASTGVAPRQVAYGVVSARLLGLVRGDEVLSATELGRALTATEVGSADECEVFRRAVESSETLTAVAPGLLTEEPPSRELVTARIRDAVGLSENTAAHRAGMLFGWRKRLLDVPDPRAVKERHLGARWHRIEVHGFRGLEQLTLDVGPLTVIHGQGSSGKSSVADALLFAHEVAHDARGAFLRRGGFDAVARFGRGPITLEHRVAATRDALEHSHRRHRTVIECAAAGFAIADESWTCVHANDVLIDINRAALVSPSSGAELLGRARDDDQTRSLLEVPAQARELSRHVPQRQAQRLEVVPARLVEPVPLDADGTSDARMRPDGAAFALAVERLRESRLFPGFLEAARNVVPGLVDLAVHRGEDGLARWSLHRTRAPGQDVVYASAQLSTGTLHALAVLVAAYQLGAEEMLVVELDALGFDGARLAVVLEALKAASRRATVVLITCDDDDAHALDADVVVHCQERAGRIEAAAPGLRLLF
jgi:predicted ATPase